ncbi:hypothetical protein [Candidatus Spongiihabitans sp.]|uniref:hypothetical protein n=1 Tax=Candidatus Spongiihabitans sp. TaxID=3101308 RepID=UPI003C6FDEFC
MTDEDRLVSGQAWRELTDSIQATVNTFIQDFGLAKTSDEMAHGYRHGSRVLVDGLISKVEAADPDFPKFRNSPGIYTKAALENPDNYYRTTTPMSDSGSYYVYGNIGSAHLVTFNIVDPVSATSLGSLTRDNLKMNGGDFEILISTQKPGGFDGNYLPLVNGTVLVVREIFNDWEHEYRGEMRIVKPGMEGKSPQRISAQSIAQRLDNVATAVTSIWQTYTFGYKNICDNMPVNSISPPDAIASNPQTVSGNACLEIADDEAAIITTDVPATDHYFNFMLANTYLESLDYANRTGSLNQAQTHINDDGKIRLVVTKNDPMVQNWLDPEGLNHIFFSYRWIKTDVLLPTPSVMIVPANSVKSHIPASTPDFTSNDRLEQIKVRQKHVAHRYSY